MSVSCRKSAMQTVRKVLSADLSCYEDDFLKDGVSFHIAEIREGRFRFPIRERSLSVVTMGKGAVVSCSLERLEWSREKLGQLSRGQIFSVQTLAKMEAYVQRDNQFMAGPDQKYVCTAEDLEAFYIPQGLSIKTYNRGEVTRLYEYPYFIHALSYQLDSPRPDMLATVAECDRKIVAIAGASGDCEFMWQIGVEVLPDYQGRGIGKAVVGTLTKAIFGEGILPYYSTEVSHLQSRQLAIRLGYWPAWTQIYARDNK